MITVDSDLMQSRVAALEAQIQQHKRENQILRGALLSSPVAQLEIDANGAVLFASTRAMQVLHAESNQALEGRPLAQLLPDTHGVTLQMCFETFRAGNDEERRCSVRVACKLGRPAMWLRAVFSKNERSGDVSTLVLSDVTDMELRQRELAADLDLLEVLFEVAGVEFFEMQPGRPIRSSRGFAALLGISPGAMVPNDVDEWSKRIHSDDRQRMQARWGGNQVGHLASIEFRVIADDGRIIWLRSASVTRRTQEGAIESYSGVVRDVSSEHSARQLLAERAALLELMPDMLIQVSTDGRLTYCNDVAERFFQECGLPHTPRTIDEIPFARRHPKQARAHLDAVVKHGQRVRFSFIGAMHPMRPTLDVMGSPVLDPSGAVVGAIVCARDVSRLVEAEQEARKTLLRLQSLVETARASILVIDAHGTIVLANRAFSEASGSAEDAVLGRGIEAFCFPEDADLRRDSVRALIASGSACFEWRMRRSDGSERWLQVDGSAFSEGVGQPRQFVFVAIDIESARRERQELIDRERWLDRVLDDAGIGAFRFDRQQAKAQIVGAYSRLYQQQSAHFVMEDELMTLILPEHRQRFRDEIAVFERGTGRATVDYPLEVANGTHRWLRAFLRSEGSGTESAVLSSVVLDITEDQSRLCEREELQRQIYQAQKTESLGVMAGGIAHDLNNMLMAALGQLNLALSTLARDSSLGLYLSTVESVLGRMEGLTERMLAYAGKSASRMEPFELAALLDSMQPLLRASAGRYARLRTDVADAPLQVRGDSTQIEQVILNFVQNAVDAIGERAGNVRLRVAAVDASDVRVAALQWPLTSAERYLELIIRDDGPGMDAVTARRIFEPFFTTKTTGRGLGLSVVQGIVKAHGGSIKLFTEPGIGTEFRVYLPLIEHTPPDAKLEAYDSSQFHPGQRRLLAVDDDEDVLAITVVMLEQIGFEVAAFLSGDDAIAEFIAHPNGYACAVVDLTMPVKDGAAVARELRQLDPTLPILFVSGYSRQQAAELAAEDEHTRFLRKPFRAEVLRQALDLLLRTRAAKE